MTGPFDWTDFFRLAEEIFENKDCYIKAGLKDAAERTVVSRAYYAAFDKSKEFAIAHFGFVATGKAEDHRKVRDAFKGSPNGWGKRVAHDLDELREWRNDSDYCATFPVSVDVCDTVLHVARTVLDDLDNHSNGQTDP